MSSDLSPFRVLFHAALALLVLCLFARPAHAEDLDRAKELFRQATEAAERSDHRAAAELYEAADRAAPRANAVFNAGQQWDAAHDTLRAADAFATAILRGGLDERVIVIAEQRVAELASGLDSSLGAIEVTGPPGLLVSIAHAEHRPLPVRVHVSPGATLVLVEYPNGSATRHTLLVQTGKTSKLVASEHPPESPPLSASQSSAASLNSSQSANGPSASRWQRPVGFSALAVGAAGIGVGVGLGIHGRALRDEWDAAGHDPAQIHVHDRAVAYRTGANLLLFGGGALAGLGVVLVALAPSSKPNLAQAQLVVMPSQIGVTGSF
ncbi:MAG TPA: hypothetical protein VGI10_28785 [Polyangiaceae bacterium]|jgi:hypothetical protein